MNKYEDLNLTEDFLSNIGDEATDWANINGVVMKNAAQPRLNNFAPFTLFPSPFPQYLYQEAFEVEKHFHTLMQKASEDHDFLEKSLKRFALLYPICFTFLCNIVIRCCYKTAYKVNDQSEFRYMQKKS